MYHLSEKDWDRIALMGYPNLNMVDDAYYIGGEYKVEKAVGDSLLLPYTVDEIIAAGAEKLKEEMIPLQQAEETAKAIKNSLNQGSGYSVIRMGDGPLSFLAHDHILSSEVIAGDPYYDFLNFAGVKIPDHHFRDMLTEYIPKADLIGIPVKRLPVFQSLFIKVARFHKWPLKKMNFTHSNINLALNDIALYSSILSNHKVLLIGNRMEELKEHFNRLGYDRIVGTVRVDGLQNVRKAIDQASQFSFDAAFAASGISASIICIELAKAKKTAIDFGQLADGLLSGRTVLKKEPESK